MSSKRRNVRVQGGWAAQATAVTDEKPKPAACSSQDSAHQYQFQKPVLEKKLSIKKPPYFSWVLEGLLAGCGLPFESSHLDYLVSQGIKYVVNLSRSSIPEHTCTDLTYVHMSIPEFCPPSMKQVQAFVELVETARENKESVVAHCYKGRGRTGTMLACYLVKYHKLKADEAITEMRRLRPKSIETPAQEQVVHLYAQYCLD